ncbi:BLUF domain-containing protein [Corynebacterium qintianiae]|uniref:BLUF domain-containing protein n=1 Tax=Corynebacterium qintianiae TaxID=2709392 RepID=A0A7T0PEY7_9CORY|nr:BLUF domain-containing protein [Corynebacterium qintianiae]QPK83731.1 BLUF domain-containing protein [Corynebacterium qintianiae]
MRSLKYLVYASVAVGYPSEETMADIMTFAQARNSSAGITGFLISRDFTYVQFLEGPPEEIDSLMDSIRADKRHHSIHTLIEEPASQRRFPKWSMHFRLPTPGRVNPYGDATPALDTLINPGTQLALHEAAEKVSAWLIAAET